jgi:hypothetical protein
MASAPGVTLLHVSDTQFGRNHRFGRLSSEDLDETFDSLLNLCRFEVGIPLEEVERRFGLPPRKRKKSRARRRTR